MSARSGIVRASLSVCLLLLGGCGTSASDIAAQPDDPIVAAALNDSLMTDPDLTGQNQANSAISDGSRSGALPSLNVSEEAIATARANATELVGGGAEMLTLGDVKQLKEHAGYVRPITVIARLQRSKFVGKDCANKAKMTAAWAARMPIAIPIYPQAAVQSAAGVDDNGCSVRSVNFHTPVALDEVMNFYFTVAAKAGFKTTTEQIGEELILYGSKGKQGFSVNARPVWSGIIEVELVTSDR